MEALEGIKVIDLCRGYPPAHTAMVLGDFGAEVIKVDPVGFHLGLPDIKLSETEAAAYYYRDRNKKSIRVNLRSQAGRELVLKLAKEADVWIENSRPGTMKRLGLDYDTLKKTAPRLIYCSVSGYGQDGPYRDLVGHDMNYLSLTGVLSLIGPKNGPPAIPSNIIADMAGAWLHSLIGILIALQARVRTGKGQFVDISYADSSFALLSYDLSMHFLTGRKRRRGETVQSGGEPCASVYRTRDGEYVTIQFIEHQFWKNFCEHIGRPDLIDRQWSRTPDEKEEMFGLLRELFLTKTREEWWEWAKDKQVMLAPVRYLEEALEDPHLRHRQMVMEVNHPTLGKTTQVGSPFKLSETPPKLKSFAPVAGQHTDEILRSLNYGEKEIEDLKKEGVVE